MGKRVARVPQGNGGEKGAFLRVVCRRCNGTHTITEDWYECHGITYAVGKDDKTFVSSLWRAPKGPTGLFWGVHYRPLVQFSRVIYEE